MKLNHSLINGVISSILLAGACVALASPATSPASSNKPPWWPARHAQKVGEAKKGDVGMLFIGDSITQGWEGAGGEVWAKYYAPRKAMNLGFNRDKTENVLWRLDNGEIDGIAPKLAVLLIGTNNTGLRRDQPQDITDGIKAICDKLLTKLPHTKILVMAILPRAEKPTDWERVNNDAANKLIAKLADDKRIFFMDINAKLLGADGMLATDIMPDRLHPSPKGYQIWADAIEPTVAKLMGEAPAN
jgi:beta-glucosidase